jgi:hypothetical protein
MTEKTFTEQRIDEAERIIADDAAELERLKNSFFVQGPDDAVDENNPLQPPADPPQPNAARRRKNKKTLGYPILDALQQFVRVLDTVDERDRHGAICWLADKYLGINIWGKR